MWRAVARRRARGQVPAYVRTMESDDAHDTHEAHGGHGERWSQDVTEHSDALDLDDGVFTWSDPRRIAASLRDSAEASDRRKTSPYRSAMSMLTFYVNRAGEQLDPAQRDVLERAKHELRVLYGREEPSSGS